MIYFIVNETARTGKNKKIWNEIKEVLDQRQVSYKAYKTKGPGHASQLASKLCQINQEVLTLIVVGGDGTMNEVLNGITDFSKVLFGMIPVGSGNDFGRGLGLKKSPMDNLEHILSLLEKDTAGENNKAAQLMTSGATIDIGKVEWLDEEGKLRDRFYGISSGVGMDAIVCQKSIDSSIKKILNKLHMGKLTYVFITIGTLFSMKTTDAEFDIAMENGNISHKKYQKLIFSAAMNLKAEGGGVPMAPKASFIDGQLSISSAYGIPKAVTFICLPILVAAKHEKLKGFEVFDGTSVQMHLKDPMALHADGEYLGDVKEVTFYALGKILHILL